MTRQQNTALIVWSPTAPLLSDASVAAKASATPLVASVVKMGNRPGRADIRFYTHNSTAAPHIDTEISQTLFETRLEMMKGMGSTLCPFCVVSNCSAVAMVVCDCDVGEM